MIFLCACGKVKSASPHRSSATKPWICEECRKRMSRTRVTTESETERKMRIFRSLTTTAGLAKR